MSVFGIFMSTAFAILRFTKIYILPENLDSDRIVIVIADSSEVFN